MSFSAGAVLIAATLAGIPSSDQESLNTKPPTLPQIVATSSPGITIAEKRPAALVPLYAAFAGLQGMDAYSTRRAIDRGATEANPLMSRASANTGAMLAVKAVSATAAIYFTERAWKKNRKGAVILMAAINGVTAAVVAHNLRSARE